MGLSFRHLFFVKKSMFHPENQAKHEEHHNKTGWVYYATMILGLWLIASPITFQYQLSTMIWSDILTGILLIILSYLALKPYNLWAQWGVIFLGVWLFIAPMIFYAENGAALMTDYLIGTLIISFAIVIGRQPGIMLFKKPGPNVPPGWSYNPSSWGQRIPVITLAWFGFFIARYMGAYQLGIIDVVWDPFFGEGTHNVLTSDVSKSFPVSDSLLGAFSYILDVLFGFAGDTNRWRTMPWVVIVFGILVIPLGIVSITLIILQPLAVGAWCSLCLCSALISMIMIPFTADEVLATVQLMIYEKKKGRGFWQVLWFGGTMEGGEYREPKKTAVVLKDTLKDSWSDLISRPWNLFLIVLAGAWLMLSPDVLGYEGSFADNSHLTGALVITFSIIAMSEVLRTARFFHTLAGLWMILSVWVIGTTDGVAMWNAILIGIALILLSFPKGKIMDEKGGFNKYIK
jgi:hypothetical protein